MCFRRTHLTTLTDDELKILDCLLYPCLACYGNFRSSLGAAHFKDNWNTAWTHGIRDDELESVIGAFEQRGLISKKHSRTKLGWSLCLTERGGELWGKERLPPWEQFTRMIPVRDLKTTPEGFDWALFSYTPSAAINLLATCIYANQYGVSTDGMRMIQEPFPIGVETPPLVWRREVAGWITFTTGVYVRKDPYESDESIEAQGDVLRLSCYRRYQRYHTWWQTTSELFDLRASIEPDSIEYHKGPHRDWFRHVT